MCSDDLHAVVDCGGGLVEMCDGAEACDPASNSCAPACEVMEDQEAPVGCAYVPSRLDSYPGASASCFAAVITNTWVAPAHVSISHGGADLAEEGFVYIPTGTGPGITYTPYDPAVGIAPGGVAVAFLEAPGGHVCPASAALDGTPPRYGTGVVDAFQLETDLPVTVHQITPYGGGAAALTAATLLLPTSVWATSNMLVDHGAGTLGQPISQVIAAEDDTTVTVFPTTAVVAGGGIPATAAGDPLEVVLQAGERLQLVQNTSLTGSIVESDKRVGVLGGATIAQIPNGTSYGDHIQQMIPPVRALGHEHAAVMHRPRVSEPSYWMVVGVVDGTVLTYDHDVGGPTEVGRGEQISFLSADAFLVESQDEDHPFLLFNEMTGSGFASPGLAEHGDPDWVLSVPPAQYRRNYVFFTDPTIPTTSLTVIRRAMGGEFFDVELDCAGALGDWTFLGDDLQWTYFDLSDGDFEGNGACALGAHEIHSEADFGLWVWGWGHPATSSFTSNVSYGYPGGMGLSAINDIVLEPEG
jgi:hypothetical protein